MPKVKVCGITNLEDAMAACEAGVDALGFVFAPEAKARSRYIDPEAALRIIELIPPFVSTVAVCVNESRERLEEYLGFVDYVQLCGEEPVELYSGIASRVLKVFHAHGGFDVGALAACPARVIVMDAQAPGAHGGTGATCDWDIARRAVALGRHVMLAGGLTPENVAEAVRVVRPFAVDVSGGVQSAPGKKDHERIRDFVRNAKLPIP